MEGVKWLLQCLNQKGECVWNACNYQMYEIDNGINQTKCQNPGPMCSVQCLAAENYDWKASAQTEFSWLVSTNLFVIMCLFYTTC